MNSDNTIFSLYEKVLLFNNFVIDKNKTNNNKKYLSSNKVKKNKSFYKICASIINNMENGMYEILIEKTYRIYRLEKYDICIVSTDLIKKVEEDVWDNIYLN